MNSPAGLITPHPTTPAAPASAAASAPTAPHPHPGTWATETLSLLTRPSSIDGQLAIIQIERIEHADRFLRFRLGAHLHKRKTTGAVGVTILDNFRRRHVAGLREQDPQVILGGVVRQVPHVQFGIHSEVS